MVEGYASLFGIADEGGDIVRAGAFRRSLRRRGAGRVRMLWQHDPARPVGVWDEIREDARGLYVRGRLIPGVAQAEDALRLIASGALDGLSIGFRARRAVRDPRSGLRRLYEIDLWEISLVTFPQQDFARLTKSGPEHIPRNPDRVSRHGYAQGFGLGANSCHERAPAFVESALTRRFSPAISLEHGGGCVRSASHFKKA
ncbi:HK97 family phage prohead protease [Stappia sp. GBMRC 2046]|uniref:HK97 family phage prohead protease n=2 Tax=Stappia sediminis TaxID=2692190 RepID=A0A7X3LVC3_9HYPH|nr:HK97 family phage prohead protease [Stappia sediminis]MXN65710.1 HK97 family phage prohead protease [Stappia sediminis]